MKTDVLIVGAGPTGLSLACQLIRFGVDFVIVDKKETTTQFSKAIAVQARTLELYEQMGLADKLLEIGIPAEGAKLIVEGEIKGELDFAGIGKGMSPYPYVLIAEQGKHEAILHKWITDHGREVLWRTELADFEQTADGVSVNVVSADKVHSRIQAKYMVGCDGARSPVRHSLGMTFEGSTMERMFYVADVEVNWRYGSSGLFAFLLRDNLLIFFGMKGERKFRIVGTFPEEFAKEEGEVLYEEIEEQIKRDAKVELDITKVHWFSTYKVHTRHVDRFSEGRCFLAGDAAHIHTPAGGQGMNTGIQDAYNLGWKLAEVIRHGANERLLGTYNAERLPNADRLTRTTDRFFDIIASPTRMLSFLRLSVLPIVAKALSRTTFIRRLIFPTIAQIAITYRESDLSKTIGSFSVHAGDRMPWFQIDGVSVYDRLREPSFHLLVFGEDGDESLSPPVVPEGWAGRIDMHRLAFNEETAKAFGAASPFLVILRPDNYIGLISDDISVDVISDYLDSIA